MARVRERSRPAAVVAVLPKENKAGYRRYIELTYRIIECKIMYYYPDLIKEGYHPGLEISDDDYDAMEIEYLKLCKELGQKNTLVHKRYPGLEVDGPGMFEVDFTRPIVHLVMRKFGVTNWQQKCGMANNEAPDKKYFAHLQEST